MGQKVHPYGFRLGFNKPWRSRWFAKQGYAKLLQEDLELKENLRERLKSAIANAQNRSEDLDVDRLYVSEAYVHEGPRMKRIRPAPMGRAYRYQRRMSHIVVKVAEKES